MAAGVLAIAHREVGHTGGVVQCIISHTKLYSVLNIVLAILMFIMFLITFAVLFSLLYCNSMAVVEL